MEKVNEEKFFAEVNSLRNTMASIAQKAKDNSNKLADIPDDLREQIRTELLKEYGKPYQDKLDYLMQFVDEEAEPQPTE